MKFKIGDIVIGKGGKNEWEGHMADGKTVYEITKILPGRVHLKPIKTTSPFSLSDMLDVYKDDHEDTFEKDFRLVTPLEKILTLEETND